jgi:hypothetical protein
MHIAIYSSFTEIHYEMFGYLIDYFISSKINFNIYAPVNKIGLEWKLFYENLLNNKLNWYSPLEFNPEKYDLIILLTDDDYGFKEEWIQQYGTSKIICIDHWAKIRRKPNNGDFLARIGTRFFNERPTCEWALPCYQIINKIQKLDCLKTTNKINIMCIGIQNRPPSGEFLMELFENFNDLEFNVITRKLHSNYENFPNIKTFENCSTDKMMDMLKSTHYVLCFDNPDNPEPINNSISAAIPMSFNFGCKLIIPKIWQKYYCFKNIITYEDTLLQKNDKTTSLKLNTNIILDDIYDELNQFVSHRNRVLDKILKLKFSKLDINKPTISMYSQICKYLFNERPNIVVDYSNNNLNILIDEFREIHKFTNQKINIALRNVILYADNIDKFNNLLYNINDTAVFILDYLDQTMFNKLSLLNKRGYIDAIFIHNIDKNIETLIKQYYSRQYITYILDKINVMVIFSQR